jgi:hypothetical protein
MAFDKFGKLLGNPESGTRCIFGHNRAPAKMVPGEILIVAHPLTGVAHRQKEKTGLLCVHGHVNSLARLRSAMQTPARHLVLARTGCWALTIF